ncbi:hypothetical protein ACFE04_020180 [Oxalis oulophora]
MAFPRTRIRFGFRFGKFRNFKTKFDGSENQNPRNIVPEKQQDIQNICIHGIDADIGLSSKVVVIMNSFINNSNIFEKLTITSREIQTAVRLVLPAELAERAVLKGLTNVVPSLLALRI